MIPILRTNTKIHISLLLAISFCKEIFLLYISHCTGFPYADRKEMLLSDFNKSLFEFNPIELWIIKMLDKVMLDLDNMLSVTSSIIRLINQFSNLLNEKNNAMNCSHKPQ